MALLRAIVFLYVVSQWMHVIVALRNEVRVAKSGCQSVCGNFSIPYPYGTGEGCFKDKGFEIQCKKKSSSYFEFEPYLAILGVKVVKLSLSRISVLWEDPSSAVPGKKRSWNLTNSPFTYSRHNNLIALGCDFVALISDASTVNLFSYGCVSVCNLGMLSISCTAPIPMGMKVFDVWAESLDNKSPLKALVGVSDYIVYLPELSTYSSLNTSVSLDYAIGEQTCTEAKTKNSANYACGDNSYCIDSTNGPGYRCHCSQGYHGNPYLPQGCQEINKCKSPNICTAEARCVNTPETYFCMCPEGYHGDGRMIGSGCVPVSNKAYLIFIGIGLGISLIILIAIAFWSYTAIKKGNREMMKKKFFARNGGLLLKQELASRDYSIKKAKIFCQEELQKATDNFSKSRILGRGGFGTVYKGMLQDGTIVAIKKSIHVDRNQTEQFINELVILSQINHKNVVRLFGCCLETDVPLLVYEFISHGTLSEHLHGYGQMSYLSWKTRLQISIEIAGALAYLHSSTSVPIFHRDIKSSNILLDENFKAKVSDFGLSRTLPCEKSHLTTAIQGTFGYLDPEYFHSGQFTEKSDVYGFGVILVELLTGRKPLFFSDSGNKSLPMHFISSMKDDCLFQVLDSVVSNEACQEQILAIAKLAKKCIKAVGKKRPTMKEVEIELERLRRPVEKDTSDQDREEKRELQQIHVGLEIITH